MAIYQSSNSSNSQLIERIRERRDRLYPNTVPASRRKKTDDLKAAKIQEHIDEEMRKKGESLRALRAEK